MFVNPSWFFALVVVAANPSSTLAFSVQSTGSRRSSSLSTFQENSNTDDDSSSSRRSFFSKVMSSAAVAGLGTWTFPPLIEPANAVSGLQKVNAKLKGFGLAAINNVPDGLTPLLEIWGKGANRFPILVNFLYPLSWVVTTPSNDVNGEDGTVQAGDYAKGDTATFFVYEGAGSVKDIASQPKSLFEESVIKAISQKGSNMYQSFKIKKVQTNPDDPNYVLVDFQYELLTGAGFEVERQGVASITSQGNAVELLWCAVTRQRFKKMEPTLRNIAGSFRCYTDGLNFSNELVAASPEIN